MEADEFKTITAASEEILFKDRNSKFYGYAFPVTSEEEVKELLETLRKKHHSARHWCYAWQIGTEDPQYRANDDGEPSNSAGMPIYGQLQSFEVTNVLVVVVRYFGGVKLGVGGLINAYKTAAQMALENSKVVQRTVDVFFGIQFDYPETSQVMRLISEDNLRIVDQEFKANCKIKLAVRKSEAVRIFAKFENTYKVKIQKILP